MVSKLHWPYHHCVNSVIKSLLCIPLFNRYVCVLKKGYQDTDAVLSSVTTKVKGIALTNTSDLGLRIWDVADYIIPPQVSPRHIEDEVQAWSEITGTKYHNTSLHFPSGIGWVLHSGCPSLVWGSLGPACFTSALGHFWVCRSAILLGKKMSIWDFV